MKLRVNTSTVAHLLSEVEKKLISDGVESMTIPDVELEGSATTLRTLISRCNKKSSGVQEILDDGDKASLSCSVQNAKEKGLYDLVFVYQSPNAARNMIADLIATGFNPADNVEEFTGTLTPERITVSEDDWSTAIMALSAHPVLELIDMFGTRVELDMILQASESALQPVLDEVWARGRLDYQMWNSIDMGAEGYTLLYTQYDDYATLTIKKVEEILDGRATSGEEVRSLMAANT